MIQLFPRIQTGTNFGATTFLAPTFGATRPTTRDYNRIPMPWPATVRNLVIESHDATRTRDVTLTLMKNALATALSVELAASANGPVTLSGIDVAFTTFDDSMMRFAVNGVTGGKVFGWCLEVESRGNIYGIPAMITGDCTVGDGRVGGALGNGFWQAYDASVTDLSTSYSICSTPGTLTTLVMKTHASAPAPGESWQGYIRLKRPTDSLPVIQDGTGGTVNTKCEMTAGNTTASASFVLPLEPGDIVEVLYVRAGGDHPNDAEGQIGVGIGFIPSRHGFFMLTGGSNFVQTAPGYVWNLSDQANADETLAGAPIGPGGLSARGLYIESGSPGPDADDEVTNTLRRSGQDTDITVSRQQLETSGFSASHVVPFFAGDTIDLSNLETGGSGVDSSHVYWGLEARGATPVIGPLAWVHWPRRLPVSPEDTTTDTFSDMDMQCPADWENGFKQGLITDGSDGSGFGDAERPASHLLTGEWQGSTFNFQIADKQGFLRAQQASLVDRYWNDALTVRMTTRANRALYGRAFTVFSGPIIEAQPTEGLMWDVTLGDAVSQGMLSDRHQVPWRKIRDGFLNQLTVGISDRLDRDTPEPILYGRHTRPLDEASSPGLPEAFQVQPIYLGITDVSSLDYHVWLVCGHAVEDLDLYVDGVLQTENPPAFGPTWLIPHHAEFLSEFGATYQDFVSDTDPTQTRRYTLIYGNFGRDEPDACARGDQTLTCAVRGVESVGDGTGGLIEDRFQQYKHFLINYVANQGPQSYLSGDWLTNPTWDVFDGTVTKVDETSFDTATLIGQERVSGGYIGAAAIGIRSGEQTSARKWIADWNRSCACRFMVTHDGRMQIFLLHPTDAEKAAAPLYTDAYEILEGSFATELKWDEHATSIAFVGDWYEPTGDWRTNDTVKDDAAITNYGRDIPSETREYPFAPGIDALTHLAILELRIRKHRPRYIRLDATIGPNPVTDDSLGYLDGGDYFRYVSFDAVQETREIRMAQVIAPGVRVGARRCSVIAMDCEDLIDYDVDASPSL